MPVDHSAGGIAMLAVVAALMLLCVAMVITGLRRIMANQRQMADLTERHERSFAHITARLAAQKAQLAADSETGEARLDQLELALSLWREAFRTRNVDDPDVGAFIELQLKMVEEDLARARVEEATS